MSKIIEKIKGLILTNQPSDKKANNTDDYANLIYYVNLTKDYSILK